MREVLTVFLAAGFFLMTVLYISYRRQIVKICRQMSFLEQNDTNMLLTSSLSCREIVELTGHMNDLRILAREKVCEYQKQEERLKQTITNLAHDIRTPLTSMDGYLQLLKESQDEAERKRYMGVIQGRVEILGKLLEELFLFAKLQNDSYRLEMDRENITQIVCEAVFSFYGEFQKTNISPEVDFVERPVWVNCSRSAVSRIVHNMIKNALEHGDGEIRLWLGEDNGRVIFRCINRVKRPKDIDMERVFEQFYKAENARGNTASTGLGLSIARSLAEKMGGEIRARLEEDMFCVEMSMKS
ncbi:MAG: HAMP domain-containing histidine kinase [Lachnospiraceae bacterium]|nr:HAMP domain-containing histidine kinase [Lachnospiraceae bacterium]